MSINHIYDTWFPWLKQLWPDGSLPQIRNAAWFMTGLYESHSVQLHQIARKILSPATLPSRIRRLARFLQNPRWPVRPSYAPVAQFLIQHLVATLGEIRLIADGSRVAFHHQLLLIAIAFRGRAVPLCWTWIPSARGHSSARQQLALLAYVHDLIPSGTPVSFVGDAEFGAVEVQQQLDAWTWQFVVRQKANNQVRRTPHDPWQDFGSLVQQAGQSVWWPQARLTAKHDYAVNLLAYWQAGEQEPWLLATNEPTPTDTRRAYRRRMWIEELFGDLKGHGFDLGSTHLRHLTRLSRLILLVVLLYVWLLLAGVRTIQRGERHCVDRRDRRDLSVFQIGWRFIDWLLSQGVPLPKALKPMSLLKVLC